MTIMNLLSRKVSHINIYSNCAHSKIALFSESMSCIFYTFVHR